MTILNGILETFNGIQYVNCTYIKEELALMGRLAVIFLRSKISRWLSISF